MSRHNHSNTSPKISVGIAVCVDIFCILIYSYQRPAERICVSKCCGLPTSTNYPASPSKPRQITCKSLYRLCTPPASQRLSPAFSALSALLLLHFAANTVQGFCYLPSFQQLAHSVPKNRGEGVGGIPIMVNSPWLTRIPGWRVAPTALASSLGICSQPLRAGLKSGAPPALAYCVRSDHGYLGICVRRCVFRKNKGNGH